MVAVVLLTAALLVWGVAIVAIDFFAQRRIRNQARRRDPGRRLADEDLLQEETSVADEAEWWLHHR